MTLLILFAAFGLLILGLLLFGVWLVVAGDRMDEHWPAGLDEEPTLNVQNGIGDSRPVQ
jgi:hypothetical protein